MIRDLGDMPALTAGFRPFTAVPVEPRPTVDELIAGARRDVADLNAAMARSRRARGADTSELREVA